MLMSWEDFVAVLIFLICWIFMEPLLARNSRKNSISANMEVVRRAWMREVLTRDTNFIGDTAIIGHTINSASFFASANLLVIMAVAGSLFIDPTSMAKTGILAEFASKSAAWVLQAKTILVLFTLLRGLLDFVWAVRQLNYCLAAIGSSPSRAEERDVEAWTEALTSVANPALKTFSKGVRSYYFTFAASLWFLGPWIFALSTVALVTSIYWRHTSSETARGLRQVRELLDRKAGR